MNYVEKSKMAVGRAKPKRKKQREGRARCDHGYAAIAPHLVERAGAFLPTLDQLAQKEDTVKVTLSLTKASVNYFKHEAAQREVCYQVMIRNLIDGYVKQMGDGGVRIGSDAGSDGDEDDAAVEVHITNG
jgi:hypothetical protein